MVSLGISFENVEYKSESVGAIDDYDPGKAPGARELDCRGLLCLLAPRAVGLPGQPRNWYYR